MTPFALPPAAESAMLVVVAYIVHSIWQGVLITILAALAIRAFRRTNATTRYAIWYVALVAVVVVPALTIAAFSASTHPAAPPVAQSAPVAPPIAPHVADVAPIVPIAAAHVDRRATSPVKIAATPVGATCALLLPPRARIVLPPALLYAATAVWLCGTLLGLLRIGRGYAALAKLQRDALPLPPGYRDAMPLWEASSRAGSRETRLCVSPHVAVPIAVGLFDGMILMPDHLLERFDRDDVDRFSLHEMAHLQRRDDWTCAFERIACAVLFFNPALRIIARQLDLEREVACDDWVVTQTREVRPYAVGLAKMASATPWPHEPVPTPAIFATRKTLSIRIERLLNKRRDSRPIVARVPAAAGGAAIVLASLVLLPVAPVIGENVSAAPAAPPAAANRQAHTAVAKTPPHVVRIEKRAVVVAVTHTAQVAYAAPPPRSLPPAVRARPKPHPVAAKLHTATVAPAAPHFARPPAINVEIAQADTAPLPKLAPRRYVRVRQRVDLLDALSAAGYTGLSADDLIALHDNAVEGHFILAAAGFFNSRPSVAELVSMTTQGVSSTYLEELGHGTTLAPKDIISLAQYSVTPSYVTTLLRCVPGLPIPTVLRFAQHGVPSRFVVGLKDRGYDIDPDGVVMLVDRGVSLGYVDAMNAHRAAKWTLPEIVRLHDRGVGADAS